MSRSRRAASGFVSGYLLVAVTLGVQLVIIPLATGALGEAEVGLWGLTQRLAYLFTLLDLGLLPSVSRLLIDHKADPHGDGYRRTLSAGVVATLMICGLTALVTGLGVVPVVDWMRVAPELREEAVFLFLATGWTIAVSGMFRIPIAMLYAWQRQDLANYAQAFGQLVNLGVFWVALDAGHGVRSGWYGQTALSLVIGLTTLGALAAVGRLGDLRRVRWPGLGPVRSVFGFGMDLFWISLGTQLALNTQGFILGRVQGLEAAGLWEVATKPFQALSQLVWKVLDASAPGLSEIVVHGDRPKLRQRFRQIVGLTTVFAGVAGVGLTLLSQQLVTHWAGEKYRWGTGNDLVLGLWLFLISIYRCHCTLPILQKSIAAMRWVYLTEGIVSVGLSVWLGRQYGATALLWVAAGTATVTSGIYGLMRSRETFGIGLGGLLGWSAVSLWIGVAGLGLWGVMGWIRLEPWWLDFGLKVVVTGGVCGWIGFRYGLDPELKRELTERLPDRLRSRLLRRLS
jgi:O-antigen/teichoic acid export membrane protein